ncbi:glucose-1-phosphate adenylyltransferase [Aeromonas schubertii]|uniref:Glucose-1-phosphate adenylyltransferase n=1 Tax=Aeromonas schubertii TaxID=652 RepID=A0ABS7VDQ0_9GAMM|nr:glucose-1-phosphate adenylyltransferase [Aeromonas schubertii]MBZ6067508.1 glucose-1-phosphate adenylyltransferase [Aeromonas schubertii]MBZ6074458.1 glucose-1-phosphate adenylyltransferase [Aeromonas schubertii]QCG48023.1 glucose-1-phosphate adenylyltransferase [Aeromonas schubertii]
MLLEPVNTAKARQLLNQTMALVLAGGRGSRLKQLTDNRAKPAVHFGGKFRIIDFVLSNCVNSGIRRIGVVTQYKSHSLLRHLQSGWSFLRYQMNEFIDLLPAQQRVDEVHWYRGTADAVYQNLDIIRDHGPKYIVVLAGDHVYKMDYASMLLDHVRLGAKVTVACIEVPREEASAFGVMAVDESRKISAFVEKPTNPPPMPGKPDTALASMGIYIFEAEFLYQLLEEDIRDESSHHDFGMNVIPRVVGEGVAYAHPFSMSCVGCCPDKRPYWRDVGTVESFWEANMDLASVVPELDVYDQNWPIWTSQLMTPPAKFVQDRNGQHGMTINSLFAGGTIVSGSFVMSSVLFTNVRVHSFCTLDQAVIFPGVEVGAGCRLRRVVVDKGCKLPEGLVVGENADEDARRFYRSEQGIVLVTRDMLERLGEEQPTLEPELSVQ